MGKILFKKQMESQITALGFLKQSMVFKQDVVENVLIIAYPHKIKFYELKITEDFIETIDLQISIPTGGHFINKIKTTVDGRIFIGSSDGRVRELFNSLFKIKIFGKEIEKLQPISNKFFKYESKFISQEGKNFVNRMYCDIKQTIQGKQSIVKVLKIDTSRGLMYALIEQQDNLIQSKSKETYIDVYKIEKQNLHSQQQQQNNIKIKDDNTSSYQNESNYFEFMGKISQQGIFKVFKKQINNNNKILINSVKECLFDSVYAVDIEKDNTKLAHIIIQLVNGLRLYLEFKQKGKHLNMSSTNNLNFRDSYEIKLVKRPLEFNNCNFNQNSIYPSNVKSTNILKGSGAISTSKYKTLYSSVDCHILGVVDNNTQTDIKNQQLNTQLQVIQRNQQKYNKKQSESYNKIIQAPVKKDEGQEIAFKIPFCADSHYDLNSNENKIIVEDNVQEIDNQSNEWELFNLEVIQIPKQYFISETVQDLLNQKIQNKNQNQYFKYQNTNSQSCYLQPQNFAFLSSKQVQIKMELRNVDILFTILKMIEICQNDNNNYMQANSIYKLNKSQNIQEDQQISILEQELNNFIQQYGIVETCSLLIQIAVNNDQQYFISRELSENLLDIQFKQTQKQAVENSFRKQYTIGIPQFTIYIFAI